MDKFNKITTSLSKSVRTWKELITDTFYDLESTERVKTKFGDTITLSLKDPGDDSVFSIFLNRRYMKDLDDADIHDLCQKKYKLHFQGMIKDYPQYILVKK